MESDRVSKVLERVARDLHDYVGSHTFGGNSMDKDVVAAYQRVLESRLTPLLRAGQAMRVASIKSDTELFDAEQAWDKSLAALEREGQ